MTTYIQGLVSFETDTHHYLKSSDNRKPKDARSSAIRKSSKTGKMPRKHQSGSGHSKRKRSDSPPAETRPRNKIACERCRKRKIRCDGSADDDRGCDACIGAGTEDTCRYNRVRADAVYIFTPPTITTSQTPQQQQQYQENPNRQASHQHQHPPQSAHDSLANPFHEPHHSSSQAPASDLPPQPRVRSKPSHNSAINGQGSPFEPAFHVPFTSYSLQQPNVPMAPRGGSFGTSNMVPPQYFQAGQGRSESGSISHYTPTPSQMMSTLPPPSQNQMRPRGVQGTNLAAEEDWSSPESNLELPPLRNPSISDGTTNSAGGMDMQSAEVTRPAPTATMNSTLKPSSSSQASMSQSMYGPRYSEPHNDHYAPPPTPVSPISVNSCAETAQQGQVATTQQPMSATQMYPPMPIHPSMSISAPVDYYYAFANNSNPNMNPGNSSASRNNSSYTAYHPSAFFPHPGQRLSNAGMQYVYRPDTLNGPPEAMHTAREYVPSPVSAGIYGHNLYAQPVHPYHHAPQMQQYDEQQQQRPLPVSTALPSLHYRREMERREEDGGDRHGWT